MPGFILGTSKLGEDRLGPIGVATASLGGLSAQATATRTTFASAQSELGQLQASANASVINYATATASLGSIDAEASTTVEVIASGSAELGTLTSQASATVIHSAEAESSFGSLNASANAEVENVVTANALLGELSANALSSVTHYVNATSLLGGLDASANTRPESQVVSGTGGFPRFVQPNLPPQIEISEKPLSETQFGILVTAQFGGLISEATSDITFSITEDESELLLLI
jgi:hypothetical protein